MTKVWLREEKGRERSEGGYMEKLLAELREQLHDYADAGCSSDEQSADLFQAREDELLERIRAELVRSFKNGVMRGREEHRGRQHDTTEKRQSRR